MVTLQDTLVSGMDVHKGLLWIALPTERAVATFNPSTGETQKVLDGPNEVWDVCLRRDLLWMIAGGGTLGRQILVWLLKEGKELGRFNCPDGAGAGITELDGKLWLTHRHKRKLFCLDPENGKVNWVIRTERESFSPAVHNNELWLIESDPGPLGHWSEARQGKHYFSRYDPVRETIVERIAVPFTPACMALDGEFFWYAEQQKKGIFSAKKDLSQF